VTLSEGQWAIDGVVMGPGTDFNVSRFEIGSPDIRASDQPRAREDGDEFGRDYKGGRTVTFELNALGSDYGVLERLAVLEEAWDAEAVRVQPGAAAVLSYCRGGQTRRVYGRPRRFAPATDLDYLGNVPITCDFRTKDHRFYSDVEFAATVGIIPELVGGLVGPLVGPVIASGSGVGTTGIAVGGTAAAWLISRIDGPIENPTIELVDHWSATLNVTLAADQWVVIDPSPWGRTVRRNDGANLAGAFTVGSRRLPGMRVPPGQQQVILRGTDPTGTSSLSLFWRSAFASY